MLGSVTVNWRAAAFARSLDEDEHELDDGTADGETEPALLLGLADRLRSVPRPSVPPDVKAAQRAQLIAAMRAEFAPSAAPEAAPAPSAAPAAPGAASSADASTVRGARGRRRVPPQRDRRPSGQGAHRAPGLRPLRGSLGRLRPNSRLGKGIAAGGLGVGVAASALGGVAAASGDALPGDSLYGFKRGMEDLRLDFADDETARGRLHLDRAATRLREARRLMERARGGTELNEESVGEMRRALAGVRADAAEGRRLLSSAYETDGSLDPMRSLSSFSSRHRESWRQLEPNLPAQLSDVRDEVSSVFDAMDGDVTSLTGLLADPRLHDRADGRGQGHGSDGRTPAGGSSPSPGSTDGRDSDTGDAAPAPSGPTESGTGELVGDGGLLDTSGTPLGADSRPEPHGSGREREVTVPPIVPHVLPDL